MVEVFQGNTNWKYVIIRDLNFLLLIVRPTQNQKVFFWMATASDIAISILDSIDLDILK